MRPYLPYIKLISAKSPLLCRPTNLQNAIVLKRKNYLVCNRQSTGLEADYIHTYVL